MNGDTLEKYYKEGLEERIIAHLAKVKNLTLEQAMDIYYSSQLAQKIHDGKDDVQYLDYKVLVQILRPAKGVQSDRWKSRQMSC